MSATPNLFLKRTVSLIERLESGVDTKIHDFANTIAEKVNQNKKWMETSDDKPEENEETCQPKELEKSPQTSPVNINIPDEDLNALLGDLAELLNDETFDEQEIYLKSTKQSEISVIDTAKQSNTNVLGNSTLHNSTANDCSTPSQIKSSGTGAQKRKGKQKKKVSSPSPRPPLSPLISSDDRSQWAIPKEGYVTLLEAYPHLLGDENQFQESPNDRELESSALDADPINVEITSTNIDQQDDQTQKMGPSNSFDGDTICRKSTKENSNRTLRPKRVKGRPKLYCSPITNLNELPDNLGGPLISQKKPTVPEQHVGFVQLDQYGFGNPIYLPLREPFRSNQLTNLGGNSGSSSFVCSTSKGPGSVGSCFCCCCMKRKQVCNPAPAVNAVLTFKHVGYGSSQSRKRRTSKMNNATSQSSPKWNSSTMTTSFLPEKQLRPILPKTQNLYVARIEPAVAKSNQMYLPQVSFPDFFNSARVCSNRSSVKNKRAQKPISLSELNSGSLSLSSFKPASVSPDSFSGDSALGTRSSIFSDVGKDFLTSTQNQQRTDSSELFGPELFQKLINKKSRDYSLFYNKPKKDKRIEPKICHSQMNFDLRIYPDLNIGDQSERKKLTQTTFRRSRGMKEFREIVCPPNCNCWNDGKEDQSNSEKDLNELKMKNKMIATRRIVPTPVLESSSSLDEREVENQVKRKLADVSESVDDEDEIESSQIEMRVRSSRKNSSRRRNILCSSSSESEDENCSHHIKSPQIKKQKLNLEKVRNWSGQNEDDLSLPPLQSNEHQSEDEAFCEEEFRCQSPDLIDLIESLNSNQNLKKMFNLSDLN